MIYYYLLHVVLLLSLHCVFAENLDLGCDIPPCLYLTMTKWGRKFLVVFLPCKLFTHDKFHLFLSRVVVVQDSFLGSFLECGQVKLVLGLRYFVKESQRRRL